MCFACIYGCVPCACLVPKEVRRGDPIPWNRNLQMVVNYYVGSGNQTQILCKNECSDLLRHRSSPCFWPLFHRVIEVTPLKGIPLP